MSVTDLAPLDSLKAATHHPVRSERRKVTGALAIACTAIIHEGLELDKAAKRAGITTHKLRQALSKPHVINWMKQQREVFRAYVCGQNVFHAKRLRDRSGNAIASLGAIKQLEAMSPESASHGYHGGYSSSPGLVIVVNGGNVTASHALPNEAVTEQDRQQAIDATDE